MFNYQIIIYFHFYEHFYFILFTFIFEIWADHIPKVVKIPIFASPPVHITDILPKTMEIVLPSVAIG